MSLYESLRQSVADEVPVALATVVSGPEGIGSKLLIGRDGALEGQIAPPELGGHIVEDARRLIQEEHADTVSHDLPSGRYEVFVDVYPVPPQLIIVGATHTAIPLARFAKALGYRVIVTDARAAFAVAERFPDADQVIKGWPQDVFPRLRLDETTYVVLLSHDPKFDEPTLEQVVPSRVPYIGAIGSRATQRQRFERLRTQGFTEERLDRVYGPVGLDIGAHSVEETALAILAEVTAVRHGRGGGFLRDRLKAGTATVSASA